MRESPAAIPSAEGPFVKFDVILTNPPFQDTEKRNTTPHKLWIDFTRAVFDRLLDDGGALCQVSPASFGSPSNKVLDLMKANRTVRVRFDTGEHFPDVASTFSDYLIYKAPNEGDTEFVVRGNGRFAVRLNEEVFYLPTDLGAEALAIHRRVVFHPTEKLAVERDYVTCHNILLKRSNTLSKVETSEHVHPVFHTNRQTWFSSIRQPWADSDKVMWTRSGYTKPFYDPGTLGGTDMAYFVRVSSKAQGEALAHNLNSMLFQYIFRTAKWSGFGNEKVFSALPDISRDPALTDNEMFARFGLTVEEEAHVRATMG